MTKHFYGLELEINAEVIAPYAQTEQLVKKAVELLADSRHRTFLDIGTGSGNIAVSILKNVAGASGVATDISQAAVDLTNANAERHGVADRISTVLSDGFENVTGQFDLIVCNAPYLPPNRARGRNPIEAYTDGLDGLSLIRQIAANARTHLTTDGIVALEYTGDRIDEIFTMFEGVPLAICPSGKQNF